MDTDQKLLTYGKIAWLWSNSELHKDWTVNLQAGFALPAIAKEQFCIVEQGGFPVAYCSWAFFDQETEEKYILNPSLLNPDSWNCGDRLWFIDWISPFSARYTWALRSEMAKQFPTKIARALRVKKGNSRGRIATFAGLGLTQQDSRTKKRQYFEDMVVGLTTNPNRGDQFFLSGLGMDTQPDTEIS
ncbi:toxin-activating lysine-acyltransferase [Pseudovibrio sp. Ad37]|uniref:toxin-activating lysine-acyltransferase n=1 Tax=Pseudovibrio sp. Ad37 TaxID=989422 RepID=UPI0007AECCDF|nr:toxin-activating lysine-acyltransferase [Pseudovibrio sp. Ad37]KZL22628.1 Cyclolysin-activating lysine-acyltransferase CyaC [Pseudovibrio sp. Ad37]